MAEITQQDSKAAHEIWVEMETRITSQGLHPRSGKEEAALISIVTLFKETRKIIRDNSEAVICAKLASRMLNEEIRTYTARWHRWTVTREVAGKPAEVFPDEWTKWKFRKELDKLQSQLRPYVPYFEQIARGTEPTDLDSVLGGAALKPLEKEKATTVEAYPSFDSEILPRKVAGGDPAGDLNRKHKYSVQQWEEIKKAEDQDILARRGADPSTTKVKDAVGLAISGGGIRSATFALGAVGALARRGILDKVDYMSTVSGGSYLGCFLSSFLDGLGKEHQAHLQEESAATPPSTTSAAEADGFGKQLFEGAEGSRESQAERHLRNNSRYLLKGGILPKVFGGGTILFGILLNLIVTFAVITGVAVVVHAVSLPFGAPPEDVLGEASSWEFPAAGLLGIGALMVVLAPIIVNLSRGVAQWKAIKGAWMSFTIAVLLIGGIAIALRKFNEGGGAPAWIEQIGGFLDQIPANALGAIALAVGGTVLSMLSQFLKSGPIKVLSTVIPILVVTFYLGTFGLIWSEIGALINEWGAERVLIGGFIGSLAIVFWSFWFVNVNDLTPLEFYRDRMSSSYLIGPSDSWFKRPHQERGVKVLGRHPLSKMNATNAAPYHIINATVNLPSTTSEEVQRRNCDFYFFSKHYCGGPSTGFAETKRLEQVDSNVDLGTATAISGAAISTSMGRYTVPVARPFLSLINFRLGYWLINPVKRHLPRLFRVFAYPGNYLQFMEKAGRGMDEDSAFLNITDGGHLENLGIYELLRRKCKYIIALSGAEGPNLTLSDLYLLQRMARIDFGIEMKFDPTDLQRDENGYSKSHAIIGKICYPGGDIGWFVSIQLTVTGREPRDVLDYRRENPRFPFQPMTNQFYDEAQFESYKSLGKTAVDLLFHEEDLPWGAEPDEDIEIADWFRSMAEVMLEDNDEAFCKVKDICEPGEAPLPSTVPAPASPVQPGPLPPSSGSEPT